LNFRKLERWFPGWFAAKPLLAEGVCSGFAICAMRALPMSMSHHGSLFQ
jgi:hypothetical protein